MGLVVEQTRGTLPTTASPNAPVYIPVTTPQTTPTQTFLRDEAFRGSPVMTYDQVQGVRHDEYDAKFYIYADTFGTFVKSILGGTDTVTGSTVYTHNIKLLNNSATGSQPQSYSILDFDGANYFTMTGAQADGINLTFGAEAAADAAVKFFANPYTSYTSTSWASATNAFTAVPLNLGTEHMIPAWDTVIQVGPVGSLTTFNYIQTGDLKIERKTMPIFTMGAQAPLTNFAGPIEVTGKFTAVVNSNNDTWSTTANATALTRSPQSLIITMTDPNDTTSGTNHSVAFNMTNVQFHNVKRTRGKEYTEVEVEFTANANSTDAASASGYSPISATIVNATSTAY